MELNYLENTQCISCHSHRLSITTTPDESKLIEHSLRCEECGKTYPSIFGLPYIGGFSSHDIISLIEIASFSDRFTSTDDKGKLKLTKHKGLDYLKWIEAIEEYSNSDKPETVLKKHFNLDTEPSWFPNRLREHISFATVTQKISFKNKKVLDIGAGSGFDSLKYHYRGAKVTAMEFNPILAAVGKINFPELRWIGGSSYTLPFQDSSFDYVTANAALHHLLDIPRSMEEMLRVLKPGGKIITISDSFSPQGTTELTEARIFNDHPDVLLGLNEQSPSFDKFVSTLLKYRNHLDVKFYTHNVSNMTNYSRSWTFEQGLNFLANSGGYFASIVITKNSDINLNSKIPDPEVVSPFEYTTSLVNQPTAMNKLSDYIPDNFLDHTILSEEHPKFRLMNGWKIVEKGDSYRKFFKRARLFYRSSKIAGKTFSTFVQNNYTTEYDNPVLSLFINNESCANYEITRGTETHIKFTFPESIADKKVTVIEFRFTTTLASHEANVLSMSELDWSQPELTPVSLTKNFSLDTLLDTNLASKEEISILTSTNFKLSLNVINRIRKHGKKIKVIIPDGQEDFFSWISNIKIIEKYPDYNIFQSLFKDWRPGNTDQVDLVISGDAVHSKDLIQKIQFKSDAFLIGENLTAKQIN